MQTVIRNMMDEKLELQIAPLIDVVFLLLIYFMVTSTLKQPEADLGITLPGMLTQSTTVNMPDEQIIDVLADGRIILNGMDYGNGGSHHLPELEATLIRYRQASAAANNKALITIQGEREAAQERVIDVMNACAGAGIKHVTFGLGDS